MKHHQGQSVEVEKESQSFVKKLLRNRFSTAIFAGLTITILSLAVLGLNLTTRGYLPVNDAVNRYFDTCVGEAFTSSTPVIQHSDRGFPLSYFLATKIPVCESGRELKRVNSNNIDFGAFIADTVIWSGAVFIVVRRYKLRRRLNIKYEA